jgi:RNA polymerase-binding transcription factor DksA
MDTEDLEYCKNLIIKIRQDILRTDNFTNWFVAKNIGNRNESKILSDDTKCYNKKNQNRDDENGIHVKARILQHLLQLDHALNLIRKGTYGTCINCDDEIPINNLKKEPVTQYCSKCELQGSR